MFKACVLEQDRFTPCIVTVNVHSLEAMATSQHVLDFVIGIILRSMQVLCAHP